MFSQEEIRENEKGCIVNMLHVGILWGHKENNESEKIMREIMGNEMINKFKERNDPFKGILNTFLSMSNEEKNELIRKAIVMANETTEEE